MNQDVKMQTQCIWVQNLKLGKGFALIAEIDLNLEVRYSNQPQEAGLNQEGVTMNLGQDMTDSRLHREEKRI